MAHDTALFQPILDNPDDDAPRLVYADWLEEHGQTARAEFIRLRRLDLAGCPVSEKATARLRERFGKRVKL